MKRIAILLVLLALALIAAFAVTQRAQAPLSSPVTGFGKPSFTYEIADTPALREQGLSRRTEIPHDYGMLFVFDTPERAGFWMKDMQVPIDIIWLDEEGAILGIERSLSPDTYPQAYYPPVAVRYVLETRAGEAALKGWEVGTIIELPDSRK